MNFISLVWPEITNISYIYIFISGSHPFHVHSVAALDERGDGDDPSLVCRQNRLLAFARAQRVRRPLIRSAHPRAPSHCVGVRRSQL